MKKLIVILIAAFSIYLFAVNDNARNEAVKEIEKIQKEVSNTGGGSVESDQPVVDGKNYTEEEISYFNEIARSSEYSDQDKGLVCKWESDVNIFVTGEDSPPSVRSCKRLCSPRYPDAFPPLAPDSRIPGR